MFAFSLLLLSIIKHKLTAVSLNLNPKSMKNVYSYKVTSVYNFKPPLLVKTEDRY